MQLNPCCPARSSLPRSMVLVPESFRGWLPLRRLPREVSPTEFCGKIIIATNQLQDICKCLHLRSKNAKIVITEGALRQRYPNPNLREGERPPLPP